MNERVTTLRSSSMPDDLPRFASAFRRPGEYLCPDALIFESQEMAIRRFLFALILPSLRETTEPFLIIQGAPGTGKTVAACDAAQRFGFGVARLPPSLLASEHEGGATETLHAVLSETVSYSAHHKLRMVAVIDDFDLSIARTDSNTGTTINTYLLTQALQEFADNRKHRNFDGSRLGVIFTANDLTPLRASLFRDGRATWYTHVPTPEEKAEIAFHLFKPRSKDERYILEQLTRAYRAEPVSFWASLKNDLTKRRLDEVIALGPPNIRSAEAELAKPQPLDGAVLRALAKTRATTRAARFL